MQVIVYFAIKSYLDKYGVLPQGLSAETFSRFERDYKRVAQCIVSYALEREKITSFMEQNGIWYAPMKGIILQNYYRELGMRQMADNDIYFDISRRKDIKNYMVQNGYSVALYNVGAHDTYKKLPFYNFEMHVYLYRESTSTEFYKYYKNIKSKLLKDENSDFGYHFSKEDFYLHTITHIYKHYTYGGIGLRFLMDVFVYLQGEEAALDWDYINSELGKLNIIEFEASVRALAKKVFSTECGNLRENKGFVNENDVEELKYYISSGTYGTKEHEVNNKLKNITGTEEKTKTGKVKYILRRLFPDKFYYEENYPFLYKTKIFIPFFVVYRMIFRGLFLKRKNAKLELDILKNKREK
jgi:hypothetical protein